MDGQVDPNGHPLIKFKLWGLNKALTQEMEGILDTGFSGFIMLPMLKAFPCGLTLASTADYNLADNSKHTTLICIGTVELEDGTEIAGAISVTSADADILLGVDFLKRAGKSLNYCPTGGVVELNDVLPAKQPPTPELPEATE